MKVKSLILITFLLSLASCLVAQTTYYSKATATNFSDVASWGTSTDGTGTAPTSISSADNFVIQNGTNMTLNANASVRNLTINNNGNLTVAANILTVEIPSANNAVLFVYTGGSLIVSGGMIDIRGAAYFFDFAKVTQSGGTIKLDGNSGVAATSIGGATGTTAILGIGYNNLGVASNNTYVLINLTGGKIIISDSPFSPNAFAFAFASRVSNNYVNVSANHSLEIGDGSAIQSNKMIIYSTYQGTLGNLIVNLPANAYAENIGNLDIKGNLNISNGEFLAQANLYVQGNIENNGILSSIGTLFLAKWQYSYPEQVIANPNPQTINGTGIFRNSRTTSTANFTNLTVSNSSTMGVTFLNANSLLSGSNSGTVSGTLTINASSLISTGTNKFILGTSTANGVIISSRGGFTPNSTLGIWCHGTSNAASFFFVTGNPVTGTNIRTFTKPSASMSSPGIFNVTYTGMNGLANLTPTLSENGVTFDRQTNGKWNVTLSNGYASTANHTISIPLNDLYTSSTTNSRLTINGVLKGTNASTSTLVKRVLTMADLTGEYQVITRYADLKNTSAQSGEWEDSNTWSLGIVPDCNAEITINENHKITVNNSIANNCKSLIINPYGWLELTNGTLTVGCTNNNNSVTVSGSLSVLGGVFNINGSLEFKTGSGFKQTAGEIIIDGNAGRVIANSASKNLLTLYDNINKNLIATGGKITIVDPHANGGFAIMFGQGYYEQTGFKGSHIFQLGDGISTDLGKANSGFKIYASYGNNSNPIYFNHFIINTPSTNNRFVNGFGRVSVVGDFTIEQGEYRTDWDLFIEKNLINNGILTISGSLRLANGTSASYAPNPSTNQQTISGTGIFRNALINPTASFKDFIIHNSNSIGVILNVPLSVSNNFTLNSRVTTTASNLLTLGNTDNEGTLNYITGSINGPFKRYFINHTASASSASQSGFFPLGKGNNYMPFWLDPNTSGNIPMSITAEVFDNNTGSSSGVSSMSNFYWAYYFSNGSNISDAVIKVGNAPAGDYIFLDAISSSGTYQPISNGFTQRDGNTLYFSAPLTTTNLKGFLSLGENNCIKTTYPINEGFENLTTLGANSFPSCWTKQNGNWASGNTTTSTLHNPRTGSNYLVTSQRDEEYIWLPAIQLRENTAFNFKFWFIGDGQNGWTGEVVYNTTPSSIGAVTLGTPFITPNTVSSTSYQEVARSFVPSANGIYYFGIRVKNININAQMLGFDDFSVENLKVLLNAKAFLSHVDNVTGIMDNYISTFQNFPTTDPYSTSVFNQKFVHINNYTLATLPAAVLANNTVVDWVFLELRTGTSPDVSTVAQTRTALILKDGKIVDMDGVSPVAFGNIIAGNYYVGVRHRNHLGMITANTITLGYTNPTLLDFTQNTPMFNRTAGKMFGGDSNADGSIDALDTIEWEIANGLFDDYRNYGDYNLDGSVDALDTIEWELNNGLFQGF